MPLNQCELEFRIEWLDRGRYFITARFSYPARDLEDQLLDPVQIDIDVGTLRPLLLDPLAYGRQLSLMLFGAPGGKIYQAYGSARGMAAAQTSLRIRLSIQGSAPELHDIRWELLVDPLSGQPLLLQENIWFSRFLSSQDYRPRPEPDTSTLKALVVVSSPSDVTSKWQLEAIDRDEVVQRATFALTEGGRAAARRFVATALTGKATLYNIVSALHNSYYDVLYLVCHGALIDGHEPRLLLEADDGSGHSIAGQELVERLRDHGEQPRLVILSSCESAGKQQDGVLAAIGPRLAAAGVPSVIAMQGRITIKTEEMFMTRVLQELANTGQIDRAVAMARSEIRERPDWWMPALFMRLKTGRLWAANISQYGKFDKWAALATDIEAGQFVPILGPGLVESSFGSTRTMARKWAERYEFPLAPRDRDDLAQVAQYLVYRQSRKYAVAELRKQLVNQVRESYPRELKDAGRQQGRDLLNCDIYEGLLNELMTHVGRAQRHSDPADVHRLLARLPIKVFVNANRDNLLRDALIEQGKSPQVQLCTWKVVNDMPKQIGPVAPKGYLPSVQQPLVFHVFGNLEYPDSLVLTEDDYFDFLTSVTRAESLKKLAIPSAVSSAFAASGWLLLGFQPDDWDFRVLLRGILKQPGNRQGEDCVRVAVQINPTEGLLIDPDLATEYVSSFFQAQGKMVTFWGTAGAFMTKLVKQCEADQIVPTEVAMQGSVKFG
jgi:hypothetical protein